MTHSITEKRFSIDEMSKIRSLVVAYFLQEPGNEAIFTVCQWLASEEVNRKPDWM